MTQPTYTKGDRVQFVTVGELGVIRPGESRFAAPVVRDGDYGTYLAPADSVGPGWHYVEVKIKGETYWAPVVASMFDVISS